MNRSGTRRTLAAAAIAVVTLTAASSALAASPLNPQPEPPGLARTMYSTDGTPVARYHLEMAWPAKIELGA
jgi:hypothetical protein